MTSLVPTFLITLADGFLLTLVLFAISWLYLLVVTRTGAAVQGLCPLRQLREAPL